jgi:pimeloyl-ACP methyl ester carboxylesterase
VPDSISYFQTSVPSHQLAYRYNPPLPNFPTVVYLYGFRSDMNGDKVLYLEALCKKEGYGFLTFDYSGHGQSSGLFEEGTISQWLADALAIIDALTDGPLILVGSSMGGWLALHSAIQRPQRVVGLIGIASAPDFTQELMWEEFTENQQDEMMNQGWTILPTEHNNQGWTITKDLIEDGRTHLLLDKPIPLTIPIRLLHGMLDVTVPPSYSHKIMDLVTSPDVTLTLIKSGNHRLSRPEDMRILGDHLEDLVTGYLLTREG